MRTLDTGGIALDARLGDMQRAYGGAPASPIPVHGGQHWEGVSNAIYTVPDPDAPSPYESVEGSTELTTGGYPVNAGASFVTAVEFTAEGPRAEGFLL